MGKLGVSRPAAAGADPIGNTICGQGVVIPREIAHLRRSPLELAHDIALESTITPATIRDAAFIDTEATLNPSSPWRLTGKTKALPRLSMSLLHERLKLSEVILYTLRAQP